MLLQDLLACIRQPINGAPLCIFQDLRLISTATTSALKAYTQNGQLIVTGIAQGETLTVYTVQGTTINSQKTDGNQVVVNLPAQGIYIVRAGAQSVKVVD
jgi:hypothetical protein